MRIAIIGAGISGLAAADKLHAQHKVTVFEKEAWVGGHARTIDVTVGGKTVAVDIGVNVFSGHDYPNLMALFGKLRVPLKPCDMSLGIEAYGRLTWSNTPTLRHALLLFRPSFYRMVYDMLRFFRYATVRPIEPHWTLADLFSAWRIGPEFRDLFLLPMASAIYTCPPQTLMQFSALEFIMFFGAHGLLKIYNLPTWYNIPGGCREYIRRFTQPFAGCIRTSAEVTRLTRRGGKVNISVTGQPDETFDHLILACHPATALTLMSDANEEETAALGATSYQANTLYVHTDVSVMPRHTSYWSSWMYTLGQNDRSAITYWVNKLQGRHDIPPLFITLNPLKQLAPEKILHQQQFEHPVFSLKAMQARHALQKLQGARNTWYCGAYLGHGFHEHGYVSGTTTANLLAAKT